MAKIVVFCPQISTPKCPNFSMFVVVALVRNTLFYQHTNRLSAHIEMDGAPSRYLISSTYLPPLENATSNMLYSLLRNQYQRLAARLRKTSSKQTSTFLDVFLSARIHTHQLKGGASNMKQQENVVEVELSAVKIQQLNKQPIIESNSTVSKDGKWLIQRTTITDIKPVSYFEKVLANVGKED